MPGLDTRSIDTILSTTRSTLDFLYGSLDAIDNKGVVDRPQGVEYAGDTLSRRIKTVWSKLQKRPDWTTNVDIESVLLHETALVLYLRERRETEILTETAITHFILFFGQSMLWITEILCP
jgi:hypothetical protein